MKYFQNNWRSFLVLSLFLGLAINFRTFLLTNVFEPIAILLWAAWRIVISVDQNIYWMILILISSILMIRIAPFRKKTPDTVYGEDRSPANRVEDWLRLMKDASLGMDQTEYLRDSLKWLLQSIQQVERFHSMNLDEAVKTEVPLLPPAVQRFLFPPKRTHNVFSGDYRMRLFFLTPKWFRRWAGTTFRTDNVAIEETLLWMESVMEINNDQ